MNNHPRGRNQVEAVDDPLTRKGIEGWLKRVLNYYGPAGVDVEVIDDQVILNQKTRAYLYGDYTPLELKYVRGSRPLLEQVVAENVLPGMSQREIALALMRRVRDNCDHGLRRPSLFHGGDEEDLLRRGAQMCNEVSRLYVCLCQIAGLPARLQCAHISGHMMTEVHVDGTWWWIDPMKGLAAVLDDDSPASTWDLMQDPTLFERQPASFWDDFRSPSVTFGTDHTDPRHKAYQMARFRDCYFNRREAIALGNYFVWERRRYTFPWIIDPVDRKALAEARREEALNRQEMGWPVWYFHPLLFNEPLKMRT